MASARPSVGSAARVAKADVVNRVAASDATAQCETSSARAPAAAFVPPQIPTLATAPPTSRMTSRRLMAMSSKVLTRANGAVDFTEACAQL